MRIFLIFLSVLLLCNLTTLAQDEGFGPAEKAAALRLSKIEKAGKLVIHYEPTVWMKLIIPEFRRIQSKTLRDLEQRLKMKYQGQIHIFVYLSAAELKEITGAPEGTGAYSAGRFIHTPFHTFPHHEMTHIMCVQWNEPNNDPVAHDTEVTDYGRSDYKFVVEGFADAMTRMGRLGIPIRHWVFLYARLGAVPSLATVRKDFPVTGTIAPGYWIAGAFFEFLIERFDIDRVKRYYFRPSAEQEIFGKSFADLETEWRKWLEATKVGLDELALSAANDVVIFEKTVRGSKGKGKLTITADDRFLLLHNGSFVGGGCSWEEPATFDISLTGKDLFRVIVINDGGSGGLLLQVKGNGSKILAVSDATWTAKHRDRKVTKAAVLGKALDGVWGHFATPQAREALSSMEGWWIWAP